MAVDRSANIIIHKSKKSWTLVLVAGRAEFLVERADIGEHIEDPLALGAFLECEEYWAEIIAIQYPSTTISITEGGLTVVT
jgi:hypothetical protein